MVYTEEVEKKNGNGAKGDVVKAKDKQPESITTMASMGFEVEREVDAIKARVGKLLALRREVETWARETVAKVDSVLSSLPLPLHDQTRISSEHTFHAPPGPSTRLPATQAGLIIWLQRHPKSSVSAIATGLGISKPKAAVLIAKELEGKRIKKQGQRRWTVYSVR